MRIEDINEIEVDPLLNNRTKCTKMTDEKSSTIKNGINGASTNNNTTGINVNNRDNSNATSSATSATSAATTAAAAAVVAAITTTISSGIYGGNNNNNNISNNSNGIQHQQQHQSILSSTDGSGCINLKKDTENLDTDNHNNHHHPNHNRLQDNHKINKYNNDIIVGGGGGGGSQLISNGSGDNNNSSIRASHQQQGIGGRLQFFKDGKFILELARAREGEKSGWVSVPRKTFWPPSIQSANTTAVNYATKNESSASLSFSDDNSSIQSSPWQRDHCWKQTTPKKCISREMCMMFKRLKNYKLSNDGYKIAKIKRRRPYDTTICKIPFTTTYLENGYIGRFNDDVIKDDNDDDDDGLNKKQNKNNEKYNDNCSKSYGILDCRNNKKTVDEKKLKKSHTSQNVKLTTILQKLIDRLPTGVFSLPKTTHSSGTINHFSSSTSSRIADYHHHQHVSPRKRILRELEKVTLEDNKRSRAKAGNVTSLSPLITTSTSMCHNTTNKSTSNTSNVQTSSANDSLNDHHHHHHNTNSGSTNSSTRLYSSYSIHSLLGHTTTNNSNHKNDSSSLVNSSTKEINNDPSYLRNVLSSPKSPENGGHHHYHNNDLVTSSSSSSLSSVMNNKKKSPTYASLQDVHRHNRSPSSEVLTNYGRVRSPEVNRSPDSQLSNRYKQQFGSPISASTTLSGFHPYLASPKYSSNNQQSTNLVAENNYKMKTLCTSNSPNHTRNTGCSRSPSAFSPSPQNKLSSFHSPTSSSTNNNCNRLREPSPSDTVSPGLERREAIPRTVPKKTVALRQQFSSPVSSPSVTQGDTSSSSTYKSGIDQKRKNIDDRTLSPDNNAIYHSGVDMEHVTAGVLRSSPVLPHSSLFYLYPPHGSPGSHSAAAAAAAAAAASSYIPPVPYYHPYAAAVAALRHPLWMHYQAGVMSSVNMQPNRLPTSIFPYNGTAGTVSASSIPSSLASMHLSPPPTAAINPWSPLSRESSVTEDPVSLVSIKDEHSSDVPLNLSKH